MIALIVITCFFLYKTSKYHGKKVRAEQKQHEILNVIDKDLTTSIQIAAGTMLPEMFRLFRSTLMHVGSFDEK